MLERAMFVGSRNNFRRDDELALAARVCSEGGARAFGLDGYGLNAGCHADLVLVDAETLAEAVARHPLSRTVIRRGRIVAEGGRCLVAAHERGG